MFVHQRLEWSLVDQSPEQSETERLCIEVAGCKIINVYKPPRSQLTAATVLLFPHPSLYVGDFKCQHVNWEDNTASTDGESLDSWATSNNFGLLYNQNRQFLFSPMERQHQPKPGLHEFQPGQPTAELTCSKKVPTVTSALPHNVTKIQGSCPQRSSEALELLQNQVEMLLPSHR